MAKLQMNWSSAAGCDENAADPLAALGAKSGKPMMVLVYDSSEDLKVLEGSCGTDERVAIGAKGFTLVKIKASSVPQSGEFASALGGKSSPRFIFFDARGKKVASVDDRISPSKVFDAMKRSGPAGLDGFVKDFQKYLTALDNLESGKSSLKIKVERLGARATKDAAVAAKQKEFDATAEKLVAREKELLEKVS